MKKKLILLLALFAFLAQFNIGCSDGNNNENTPISLVIIAGRHANARMYTKSLLEEKAKDLIKSSIIETSGSEGYTAKAQVSIIICDGNPEKVEIDEGIITGKANNDIQIKNEKNKIVNNIIDFLVSDNLRANDPEVDLLGAVSEAQKILNADNSSEHHILVLDTGITTSGYLDMRKIDISEIDNKNIIEHIKDGIPNLNGTKVTFLGLGNVAEPQKALGSVTLEDKFLDLWRRIVEFKGGELEGDINLSAKQGDEMQYYDSEEDLGYEPVGTVFFPSINDMIVPSTISTIDKDEPQEPQELVIFEDFYTGDLAFKKESSEFRDIEQAHYIINEKLIKNGKLNDFINNTDYKIYVVGSIAKVTSDQKLREDEISAGRARAVRDLLVNDYNVPTERIEVIDAGDTVFSWRNAVEFPEGVKDPSAQEANRVVAVISENSTDLVQELIDNGYIK